MVWLTISIFSSDHGMYGDSKKSQNTDHLRNNSTKIFDFANDGFPYRECDLKFVF